MRWRLDQLVGVKEAARSLPALIERKEPVVLTRRGEPVSVLVPLAEYEGDGRRQFTLYRLATDRVVGQWQVAGEEGPPESIVGRPVEVIRAAELPPDS